jgi:two-component system LytT family response regulator
LARAEFRVLIADDEPAARRGVRQLLAAHPEFLVAGECRNGAEVLASLDMVMPDVVFLDIAMPGVDGFEVIRRRTPERMPTVVFLTAYDQFAIRAFDAEALDYLVKPVSESRFASTMRRVLRRLRGRATRGREEGIVVTTSRGTTVLRMSEIDWIESADNYVKLWIGTRNYLVRESMGSLEKRASANGFVRAHRSALVRVAAVRNLTRDDEGALIAILETGARIPISRRRRAAFAAAVRAAVRA